MLSQLYSVGVRLRNRAYDRGFLETRACGVPVLSVGNITVGGAGKTPLAGRFAGRFLTEGYRTVLVTRGYGRRTRGTVVVSDGAGVLLSPEEGGDEAVMLALALPSLVVIADEQRVRGCELAVRRFGAERIVLDDAFQHRSCARAADVVAVDAMRDLLRESLLPSGRLREPLSSLRRASMLILTRCESADAPETLERLLRAHTDAPLFRSRYEARMLTRFPSGDAVDLRALAGREVLAFCGIASPLAFRRTAEGLGVHIVRFEEFRDHHPYTAREVTTLRAVAAGAPLLTTEKDAVRLAAHAREFAGSEVYYPVMRAEFEREDALFACIDQLLAQPATP